MTSITSVPNQPGRVWGVFALVAAIVPLPFLLTLNILSLVVQSQPAGTTIESTVYGIIAIGGLFFFPAFFLLATILGVRAVLRPRVVGKVLGWAAIAIVILAIPLLWFGYGVWIFAR
ncbi:MAG: hypothetical protein ABL886_01470 [Rhodoglobus sp.]